MQQPAFTIHRGSKQRGMGLPMHSHEEAQRIYAAAGMVQIHTPEGRWLVPSQLAVWIPAGTSHMLEVLSDAQLWMVQWQPAKEEGAVLEGTPNDDARFKYLKYDTE